MPSNVLLNPLVTALLGILVEGPAHAYQLHLELRRRRLVSEDKVSRGTLYHVIGALEQEEWIRAGAADRKGGRPQRVPYSITDKGFEELRKRLDGQIRRPAWAPDPFFHSVSHIGVLGRAGGRDALRARSSHLKRQIELGVQEHTKAIALGTPRLFVIEAEYELHRLRAELKWVNKISEEIETGALPWPKAK